MIDIRRSGTKVILTFTLPIENDTTRYFCFSWDARSEWAAGLLTTAVSNYLWNRTQYIRRKAYENGWKDAKSHRNQKADWFSGEL